MNWVRIITTVTVEKKDMKLASGIVSQNNQKFDNNHFHVAV